VKTLQKELDALENKKDDFIRDFGEVGFSLCCQDSFCDAYFMAFVSMLKNIYVWIHCFQDDYNEIVDRWKAKQSRGESKEQMWGLFIAKKK